MHLKRCILGGWVLLAHDLVPLIAQPVGRIDLNLANRYVWHGLSRATGMVLQPSVAVGYQFDRLVFGAGMVRHYELGGPGPGQPSQLASGTSRVGEDDAWAQVELALGSLRLRSGFTRYVFRAGPPRNTTEVSAAIAVSSRYLNPALEVWWDIGRVRGGFVRASASSPVFGWPAAPYVFAVLTGEVGLNVGQSPDPARRRDPSHFASRGFTHAAVGLSVLNRLHHWNGVGSANLNLGLHGQLNLDDATRYDGPDRQQSVIFWFSAGVTLVFGGEARRRR